MSEADEARALGGVDPIAARSRPLVRFFGSVMARAMARNFHAVRIARATVPALPHGRPAVIYLNHPSWWDPAFCIVLSTRLFPDRRGFGPIDAAALGKYRFMSRIGLFGVEQGTSHGAIRFLDVGQRILVQPDALLWITPEGNFADPRSRPVRLQAGLSHLLRRAPHAIVAPLALEYVFWSERFPEALARFGAPFAASERAGVDIAALQHHLRERLHATMDALAEDAVARDHRRFETLLAGRSGVGGIYDLWRRARARMRGQRFDPEHAPQREPGTSR